LFNGTKVVDVVVTKVGGFLPQEDRIISAHIPLAKHFFSRQAEHV
jgi:hypothetical protein